MLAWMLYATGVATLLGLAAAAVEGALGVAERSTRGVWTVAAVLSLTVPALTWTLADAPAAPHSAVDGADIAVVTPTAVPDGPVAGAIPALRGLDRPLRTGWLGASAALLLLFGLSAVRLAWMRRRWAKAEIDGVPVRVAPRLGPAAVGLWRPEVVVPRWVLDADPEARRWIVAHEAEHVRVRDPARVMFSLLLVLLVPWNAALWWQLRRLRLAVEADCDRRVLRRTGPDDRRRYGALLLEVGRRSQGGLPVPAFAERHSFLERRIRLMTRTPSSAPIRRAALLTAAGVVLVVAACTVPGPDRSASITGPELQETTESPDLATPDQASAADEPTVTDVPVPDQGRVIPDDPSLADEPTFTPYTVAPRLTNQEVVRRALEDAYPSDLRDAGIGGRALVYLFIDADGEVRDVRLNDASGHDGIDEAALEVARGMEFAPGKNGDRAVPVWITLPISFGVR